MENCDGVFLGIIVRRFMCENVDQAGSVGVYIHSTISGTNKTAQPRTIGARDGDLDLVTM